MNRKQLTAEDIIARESDCQAEPCRICKGEGFVDTDVLCWCCDGSGAVMVPKPVLRPKRPVEVTWRTVLGIGIVFAVVLGILVISLSEYLSTP
jgi:hypothetical protein